MRAFAIKMERISNILVVLLLLVLPMAAQDSLRMTSIEPLAQLPTNDSLGNNPMENGVWTKENDPLLQMEASSPTTPKKQPIDARVVYSSSDSLVMTGKGIAHMYGSGEVKYKALELTADYIRVCMDSSTIYACGVFDSIVDEWSGLPVFKDANDSYESKEITYNLKTQKG